MILDVQQFSPEEITVKTRDNCVIVEAKHEERQDEHGFIQRHFVRRYVLPSTHDVMNVTSSLSSDGVLTITAPQKVPIKGRFVKNHEWTKEFSLLFPNPFGLAFSIFLERMVPMIFLDHTIEKEIANYHRQHFFH